MKTLWITCIILTSSLAALAGSDEGNNPTAFEDGIKTAQFIFIGKLKVETIRFIEDGKIVADKDGKILKAFQKNPYENKIIPEWVRRWATIEVEEMLRGDAKVAAPFLKESWTEPSRVMCPHHSNALSGEKRIWFVALKHDMSEPSLISMPIQHLEAVKKLITKK